MSFINLALQNKLFALDFYSSHWINTQCDFSLIASSSKESLHHKVHEAYNSFLQHVMSFFASYVINLQSVQLPFFKIPVCGASFM